MIETPRVRTGDMAFDWTLKFAQPPTIAACAFWKSCCRDRAMPEFQDMAAASMQDFAGHIGFIEIRPESDGSVDYFIRLAGEKWEEIFGAMSGRYIHEFLPPAIEMRWRDAFDRVREAKAPARVTARIHFQLKFWLRAEMLIAPLGGKSVSMLFMTFVASRASAPA